MNKITFIIFFCVFSSIAFGQIDKSKLIERKKIHDLFYNAISRDNFKDTNMVYMFAVKVNLIKNKNGKIIMNSFTVSDSSAKLIYKNFDFLERINYEKLTGDKVPSILIFPICIFLEYPGKKNTGMIDMKDLQEKMEDYWYRDNYIEEPTETYKYIPTIILRTSTVEDI